MNALVTAIIITYKRPLWQIEKAIKSVLNQTYHPIELILVDDNGLNSYSENNQLLVQKYKQIKCIKHDKNKGACAARNTGIEAASGEYIAFLDDDDEWLPEKIEKQMQAFDDEKIGIVYCRGFTIIEKNDETIIEPYLKNTPFIKEPTFEDLLFQDVIGSTSQPLIRKECFQKCGGFLLELPARQDYEMWLRISKSFRIKGINEALFHYHIYDGEQITKSSLKAAIGNEIIYKKYKEELKKNKEARYEIISRITWYYKKCNYKKYIYYFLIKCIYYKDKKRL